MHQAYLFNPGDIQASRKISAFGPSCQSLKEKLVFTLFKLLTQQARNVNQQPGTGQDKLASQFY